MATLIMTPSPAMLASAIVRDPLIVCLHTRVTDAIALMGKMQASYDPLLDDQSINHQLIDDQLLDDQLIDRKLSTGNISKKLDNLHRLVRSSCVLVAIEGKLLGILTERDIVRILAQYHHQPQAIANLTMAEVMTHPVFTLPESILTDIFTAVHLLLQKHLQPLPIINAANQIVGLVSHETLLQIDKQQLQAHFHQSEAQKQAMLMAIPDLIYCISSEGIYLEGFSSSSVANLLPADINPIGKHISQLLLPEIAQRKLEMIRQALATGKIQVCEQKNVINGKIQYEKVQMVKLNNQEVLEIIRNITEQRYQEKILAGQQRVLEMLARGASLPDILQQLIQFTEEQSPEMLGSILLLSGQRLWYGVAPSLPEDFINLSHGILIGDRAGSCGTAAYRKQQIIVADIEHDPLWQDVWQVALQYNLRACWSTPIFAQSGEVLGTFAMYYREPRLPTAQDLELVEVVVHLAGLAIARKRAEEASQASESRYRLLAENTHDLICLHSLDCKFVYVSPSCKSLLGYDCEELIGQTFHDFIHPEDGDRLHQETQIATHTPSSAKLQPITYRIQQKSGDYIWLETLAKPILDLAGQIIQIQTTSRDITERVQAQESLRYGAFHDSLTGLPNRDLLMERLELAINRIKRHYNYHFAVLFLDLDRFKVINDSLGHGAGDQLLIAVADKLKSILRNSDLAVRLGGDEFVILLDGIKDIQDAVRATKRVFRELAIPSVIGGRELYINTSIGIAFGTNAYTQAADILRDADIAMYQAKKQGRGSYEIFNAAMHKAAIYRLHLENDLRQALERQELVVYYQPIIDLRGVRVKKGMVQQQDTRKILPEQIMGFEALVRWQHPHLGLLSPLEFIPLAEETGLIVALDRWIFSTACQQLAAWQTKFPCYNLKMNLNLSAQDLVQGDLLAHIDAVLAATGISGESITIEITESTLIDDIDQTIALLEQLKARKIRVSIDDFGTGYSSLSYLPRLPMDNLKIDRSFVGQMEQGNRNYQVVSTIIALSNQLELGVVAEGIETTQQLQWLQELGCEFGQGYLFAQPLTSEAIEELLLNSFLERNYFLEQG